MLPNKPFINKPFPIQSLHIKHQLQTKISIMKYQLTHYYNGFQQLKANQLDYGYMITRITLNHQK